VNELKIGRGLSLGLDSVTKTFAILAQRRKGKTYTASVIAEEMIAAGQPWVALDPTGAWWGLRASADGKKEGLPVLVIGGAHGQLPLERTAGKLMADLVVDEPAWYVFDFSLFESKAAERQFATDFAERFYRRKGKVPGAIHLFVDEADMFVPQRTPSGDQRMLGAFEAIVRRGGIRGIGTTLISQRAAVVNKNVLEQIDVLIALRTVGPNDQKAIKAYVDAFGTQEEQDALMASLAKLALGEAWFWEPGGDLFQRVQIRERRTFNSSATPKAGQQNAEPAKLADVDLDELRDRIAATVEKAKAENPAELQKLLRERDQEIARLQGELEQGVEPETVEVPVLTNGTADDLRSLIEKLNSVAEQIADAVLPILSELQRVQTFKAPSPRAGGSPRERAVGAGRVVATARPAAPPIPSGDLKLGRAARAILAVLVDRSPVELTRSQVSTLSGYKPKSSTFANALSELRTKGLMEGSSLLSATEEGLTLLGDDRPAPKSPEEVRAQWLGALPQAPRTILETLIEDHPHVLTRDEVAKRTGYSTTSSTFANALSTLRTNGLLIDGPDRSVGASGVLFE